MQRLKNILAGFRNRQIAVIGDVMLDKYIFGEVNRISPEAPVGIVKVTSEEYAPGGAANVASNISGLGGKAVLFGFVGSDNAGKTLVDILKQKNVSFFPSFCENQTIQKVRVSPSNHQLLRLDYENTEPKCLQNRTILQDYLHKADFVVISDYAKGAITTDLMSTLKSCRNKIIVDPKPQNIHLYNGVFLVKMNELESERITQTKDVHESARKIKDMLGCNVIITRGSKGMLLFNGDFKELHATAKDVYDVTGAGDTALAALAMSLSSGSSLEDAAIIANYAAGIKVEKHGTSVVTLSELEKRIFSEEKENKIKTRESLKEIVADYQSKNKKVVWTNGCFDILHHGHVSYLKQAREKGDVLIVGLNSDDSIRKLKGPERPIMPQEARAEILSSLECVNYVTIFDESNVANLLLYLKPDFFVKASDYNLETMNAEERKALESYGGKAVFVPIKNNVSTSSIINRIRNG